MSESIWDKKIIIAPSLITLNLCQLAQQVTELEEAGIELLHIDILDGYFSPSMPIGLDVVRQLREITTLPFDVHLMVRENEFFVYELLDVGIQQLVFHIESEEHIDNRLNMIHSAGVRAGVALKPATSLHMLDYVLEKCDTVLLMLINPGYASDKAEHQMSYSGRKIRELKRMINERGTQAKIELDGRVSIQNIEDYGAGLADIFVAGSTCIDRNGISHSSSVLIKKRLQILGEEK